jgi:phage baseplate assembly protein W
MANTNNLQEYAVSLPFTINPNGVVNDTVFQEKIWADKVLSVIGTGVSERLLRYNFGSKMYQEHFGTQTAAKEGIYREIYTAFSTHLPLLSLKDVLFSQTENDSELVVEVRYSLPNDLETTTYIGKVSLRGDYPASEEF